MIFLDSTLLIGGTDSTINRTMENNLKKVDRQRVQTKKMKILRWPIQKIAILRSFIFNRVRVRICTNFENY